MSFTWSRLGSTAVTALLVLSSSAITALLIKREFWPAAASVEDGSVPQPDWRDYAKVGNRIGPADAEVVMVEFADFECPACGALEDRLESVRDSLGDKVAVIFRHFPLSNHSHAFSAAVASECAADQGRFESMYHALYRAQDSIGKIPWDSLARQAGVGDLVTFSACMQDSTAANRVTRDATVARTLGMKGTPTIMIDGERHFGALATDRLIAAMRKTMEEQQ